MWVPDQKNKEDKTSHGEESGGKSRMWDERVCFFFNFSLLVLFLIFTKI